MARKTKTEEATEQTLPFEPGEVTTTKKPRKPRAKKEKSATAQPEVKARTSKQEISDLTNFLKAKYRDGYLDGYAAGHKAGSSDARKAAMLALKG